MLVSAVSWAALLTRTRIALVLCAASGCGRFGVQLLSVAEDGSSDAGTSPYIVGPPDTGTTNVADAGEVDAAAECMLTCQNSHGTASCVGAQCLATCSLGFADCDLVSTNGCESTTTSSVSSCGGCGGACSNANGSTECVAGLCSPVCAANFGDCDSDPSNGCETDLTSVSTCGACETACLNAHGTTNCGASGSCAPSCASNFGDCDGDLTNGCETDLASDPAHCGSCGRACGSNGQICVAGACQASPCATGFAECDGNLTQTCETNTQTSLANCGFCNNACATPHATATCALSTCQIASCNAGYADCDASPVDGCEVALATNTANCGSCGMACSNAHGTTSCLASACKPSCSVGFDDCDGSKPNGCETPLDTIANCGGCGVVCPANGGTPQCSGGLCTTICDLTGTYALKLTVAVSWNSQPYISSGSGTIVTWSKLQVTQSGNSLSGSLVECARTTPDFHSSLVSETYNLGYPNALYDHTPSSYLTPGNVSITLGSASPGASFSLARTAQLMGASMADPINGTWPSSASGLTQVDTDQDGKSGVTAAYKGSGGATYPPTAALFGVPRSDAPYVAARIVFSLSGTLSSCTQSAGSASVAAVDTAIFGCHISGGGDCNGTQSTFFDNNQPRYRPGSATYSLVKLAAGASCASARAAL